MKKQRKSYSCDNGAYYAYYNDDDDDDYSEETVEVAEILLQFPKLISKSYILNLSWGAIRKRTPLPIATIGRSCSSSSPPNNILNVVVDTSTRTSPLLLLKDLNLKDTTTTSSPVTPLSLNNSTTESDSTRSLLRRKISKKKTKEEWEEILMNKIQQHQTFKKEVEKVKEHYESLRKQNLKIKSIAQQVSFLSSSRIFLKLLNSHRGQTEGLLLDSNSWGKLHTTTLEDLPPPPPPQGGGGGGGVPVPFPFVGENPSKNKNPNSNPLSAAAAASGNGHLSIPDLNFTIDETSSSRYGGGRECFDLRKAAITAAEARRKRFEMNKLKKIKNKSMAMLKTRLQIS